MEKEEKEKSYNKNDDKENIDKNMDSDTESLNQDNEKKIEKEDISTDQKIKNLEDKLARTLAEMENQRRRFEKERDDAFEYGGFAFAKEALNLIDNLERSKQSLENDEALKNTKELEKISEHLDIIYKDTISIFKKNNIESIKSINEKLDPNLHQAMMEIEDDTKESGTIVQEIQKGFLMKDRLLRPSLVGVSKKTNKNKDSEEQENKKTIKNQEKQEENK
tara:strand:+ start:1085 stop:1747 length:663 start_codon:yes stop_codon:yes gene_type:complete